MKGSSTYPEREYVAPVHDFYDVIEFELDIHPNGPELRKGIVALSKLYEQYPLNRTLQQCSRLMALSHAKVGISQFNTGLDIDFHRGSLFATHCILRSQPRVKSAVLLEQDLFRDYKTDDDQYDIPLCELEKITDGLLLWSRGEFMSSLNEEPEKLQELVITAAIRAFDDIPNSPNNEDSFISGFMMAKDLLILNLIEIDKSKSNTFSDWRPRV